MKIALQFTIALISSLLAAYSVVVAARNGVGVTSVGSDVYAGMFAIPVVLLLISIICPRLNGSEIRTLRIASFAMPLIVIVAWILLVLTNQVATHTELMKRGRTSRDAPTGHKLFNFISTDFQSRRWAHI